MSDSTEQLHPDIESVLYDEDVLRSKCAELGAAIATDYKDLSPLLMVTITGAYMFASDLAKVITPVPRGMQIDFIRASSYGSGTVSSGDVRIQKVPQRLFTFSTAQSADTPGKGLTHFPECSRISVAGRHVIIVEDIVDTGGTLDTLIKRMTENGAASVKVAALLNKEARRKVDIPVQYEGFKCEDSFVVGYGMDYAEDYRTLPYVGVLKPNVYSGN